RIVYAGRIAKERTTAIGRIRIAGGVVIKSGSTICRVIHAGGVKIQRLSTVGRVMAGGGVAEKRERSVRRVSFAGSIAKKRGSTRGRVLGPRAGIWVPQVGKERPSAKSSVKLALSVAPEREVTDSRVVSASGKTKERALPLSRIAVGIAAVGWWAHRPCGWRKSKATKHQQNCSECDV